MITPRFTILARLLSSVAAGLLLSILQLHAAEDAEAEPQSTIRLLTIGNSFANNSVELLRNITKAAGHEVILGRANPGGGRLERHWKAVEAFEANSNKDPIPSKPRLSPEEHAELMQFLAAEGKLYRRRVMVDGQRTNTSEYVGLRDLLTSEPWDYVTLQQHSMLCVDYSTFEPYALLLQEYIRKHAPTAEILVLQTWAYRKDSGLMAKSLERTQEQMYKDLTANYQRLGERLGSRVIPVGSAFQRVFELENPPEIATSDQEQVEWNMALHSEDTRHASAWGKYLASATLFECLFGESVVGNSYIPSDRQPDGERRPWNETDVLFLQEIAHEVVRQGTN